MLYNISYLCTYYTSSISSWEEKKTGNPLDGINDSSRFSFHTVKEDSAFIHVSLLRPIFVDCIEIIFRESYSKQVLPVIVYVYLDGKEEWTELKTISSIDDSLLSIKSTISSIRIIKRNYGHLNFSNINIWCPDVNVIDSYSKRNAKIWSGKFIYVKADWYGLGGRLAVIASALGFLGSQSIYKSIYIDKLSAVNLDFPPCIESYDLLKNEVASSTSNGMYKKIFNEKSSYSSEQLLSHQGLPSKNSLFEQDKNFILITRDFIRSLKSNKESLLQCSRRLYARIIPNSSILERVVYLEEKFGLKYIYNESLAIHIRHGNGERYYSHHSNKWGVKPPCRSEIIDSIKHAIESSTMNITTLVLASDCKAVYEVISEYFSEKYEVVFISLTIQDIGAGCNHNNSVFDRKIGRKKVDNDLEEVVTFSEILLMSKCKALCGGNSYFFDAIRNFSNCEEVNIFSINNSDRYTYVEPNVSAMYDFASSGSNDPGFLMHLRESNFYIDGLFIENTGKDIFSIYYFDEIIFSGNLNEFKDGMSILNNRLLECRLY